MISFIRLFLLSYFIIIPVLCGALAHWFFGIFSEGAGDVMGWVVGLGALLIVSLGAILRITSMFKD